MKKTAIAILCTLPCMGVQADEVSSFELEFSRDQIPLNDNTVLDVDGMGIRYSESSALPLQLTLSLGREVVNHDDDPLSLGFQPDGYYAGVTIGYASSQWHSLQVGADLSYSYHSATQEFNLQQLEIDWHRAEARGWLALHLNDIVKLYGCAIAINIDGAQTINGSTPSRVDFKNEQHSGYCGGIELEVGNDGYIGLEAESRHQHGGRLYFGKRYLF
jgi:hypothetical protein